MALYQMTPGRGAGAKLTRPVELVCFALVVAQAVYLGACYIDGIWLIAPDGSGIASDFVNVWAAGKLALAGHAAAAYDGQAHKLVEESAVGHPFAGYYVWPYPPTFLFVAAVLSLLPYTTAFLFWVFATFPAYLIAIRAIIGDRIGYLLAAAFPAVLSNFIVGQNGFLTAGLIGGALLLLESEPVAAGALIGLLSFKPQLGLLFPIALAAGGRWRAFAAAATVTVLLAAAAWLAFGTASWLAFFASLGQASQAFLAQDLADWSKFQTAFGLARTIGGSEMLAWSVQIAVALCAAGAIAALWRSDRAFEIKAAALGTGAMLATPYLFTYDLVILAVPLAFLFRLGRTHGFLAHEAGGIGVACVLILIFPFVKAPVGFAAVLIVAALIARRALAAAGGPAVSAQDIAGAALPSGSVTAGAGRPSCLSDRTYAGARLSDRSRRHLSQRRFSDRPRRAGRSPTISSMSSPPGGLRSTAHPAAAYDWPTHKRAEVRAIGHDFADYYGWHYPPTFLFVAAALATLPLSRRRDRLAAGDARRLCRGAVAAFSAAAGIFVALGFPAALWNITAGQNGFLTAALIGGTLGLLERRPALAGVCLGLLTYKPQFGLLFPLVLIADRRWLTIGVAAAVAVGLAALSWLAFGSASWAGLRALDADHQPRRARRRPRRLEPAAKPVRPGPRPWRQRAAGLDRAGGGQLAVAVAHRLAVAQPRAVRSEGRGARRRHAGRDALRLYVRSGRARGRGRLSAPLRARTRILRARGRRPWRRRRADPDLSLRQDPGRARRGVDRVWRLQRGH